MALALLVTVHATAKAAPAVSPSPAGMTDSASSMVIKTASTQGTNTGKTSGKTQPNWLKLLPGLSKGCTPLQIKAGKCGKQPGTGGRANGTSTGTGGGGNPVVCINGTRIGASCVCRKGGRLQRVRRNTYRCVIVDQPCHKGYVRIRNKCVRLPTVPPPGSGQDSGSGPTNPGTCIGGSWRHRSCSCPSHMKRVRVGRRSYRCIVPPCPTGRKRIGLACVLIGHDKTEPLPPSEPPRCRPGWRLKNDKCVRNVGTACPAGTERRGRRCVLIPPASIPPIRAGAAPAAPLPQPAPAAAADDAEYEPGEVLVQIEGATPQQIANRLIRSYSLITLSRTQLTAIGVSLYRFGIPANTSVETVVAQLSREPGVASSQPNWRYKLNTDVSGAAPRPAIPPQNATMPQYAPDIIGAREAHKLTQGAGVLVAVIDTGIDETHPELAGSVTAHYNAFPAQKIEPDTHGTAIAGIIAAHADLAGIAPQARILAVQAFTSRTSAGGGDGTAQRIAAGLNWAIMKGARVINMSFARISKNGSDAVIDRMLDKADSYGIVLVAAAGNGGPDAHPAYPASLPAVIAVTAIDEGRALYQHANVGDYIDISAPGVGIMAPTAGGAYDLETGTSFAAAHISGVAALMLSGELGKRPGTRLIERLKQTAVDLGPPGPDAQFGAGIVDALKALGDVVPVAGGSR
ncbi:MAG: S8 family serine peptidase [Hyphomicrobiaceae bacterium]|nr:S8 family serine peptidase [Hyphomicrobiaceae bacterium]